MRRHDRALATLLEEAARDAAFPETPPLAGRVRARIEAGPIPVAEIDVPRARPPLLRPAAATALALVLAVAVTLALSVPARRAVADLLGVAGIRISFDEEPALTPRPAPDIRLGDAVSKEAAGEASGLHVLVPEAVSGTPAFYLDPSIGESGRVSVVYPREAATLAEVDLLVSQFVAAVDAEHVKKLATLGSEVEHTTVRSSEAYWIGGEPHLFFYEERNGDIRQETLRLAGNVLLWNEDGVTYRVEGAASLTEALRIAGSLR